MNKMDDAVQFSEERFLAACQVVAGTEGVDLACTGRVCGYLCSS